MDEPYKRAYFEINIALLLVQVRGRGRFEGRDFGDQRRWNAIKISYIASYHPGSQGPGWQVGPPGLANGVWDEVPGDGPSGRWINNIMLDPLGSESGQSQSAINQGLCET